MLQQLHRKHTSKRVRFPGIVKDARALGISRITLWRYLSGEWPWPRYTRTRYELLKGAAVKKARKGGRA